MIGTCVVDASAAAAVAFREPAASIVAPVLFRARALRVPHIFHVELASVGRTKVLRGELDWPQARACLAAAATWPLTVVPISWRLAWETALRSGLTVYDACYLCLARKRRLRLLTLDAILHAAAGERALP